MDNTKQDIEVIYSQEKQRLTIKENGKIVGGFAGPIALRIYQRIVVKESKIIIENGNLQPIV